MDTNPSNANKNQNPFPEPEQLKARSDEYMAQVAPPAPEAPKPPEPGKKLRRRTYRPSHRATFIGLAVVIFILLVNAVILDFVLKGGTKNDKLANTGQVTISPEELSKVGVNSSTVGSSGVQLVVDPDAQFNGKMTVAGDVSIGGGLKINSTFTASDANLTQLEAGNTSLSQLDVNGNSTLSSVSLRNNLAVAGTTQLQGQVTVGSLLTVDNNLTVTGNLAVGGTLSTNTFSANNLTSVDALTVGGHIIAVGLVPSAGPGGSVLGANGTVGISGNDSAGIISIHTGTTPTAEGTLVNVAFHTPYSSLPSVVISPVGSSWTGPTEFFVLNVTDSGFSVGVYGPLSASTTYAVDYIVVQQ